MTWTRTWSSYPRRATRVSLMGLRVSAFAKLLALSCMLSLRDEDAIKEKTSAVKQSLGPYSDSCILFGCYRLLTSYDLEQRARTDVSMTYEILYYNLVPPLIYIYMLFLYIIFLLYF